jgi:hypothetical protein
MITAALQLIVNQIFASQGRFNAVVNAVPTNMPVARALGLKDLDYLWVEPFMCI